MFNKIIFWKMIVGLVDVQNISHNFKSYSVFCFATISVHNIYGHVFVV
jgi:hypothetical protein